MICNLRIGGGIWQHLLARIFNSYFGGHGQYRNAGFQTCGLADFQIGRASKMRGARGFGNPRYSRLGSLRYWMAHEISGLAALFALMAGAGLAPAQITASDDVSNLLVTGPVLNVLPNAGSLVLQWNSGFTLQSATNVIGPYADLTGATSLYTNPFTNPAPRFFRLRQ